MSIFDDIKNRIFGAPAASGALPNTATPAKPQTADAARDAAIAIGLAAAAQVATASAAKPAAPAATPAQPVDVAAVLDAAVAKSGQKLNWKTSIVDLLKALDLDSSLTARKELADELGYTGDKSDSAAMNIWLHKQVVTKLAANGGTLPPTMLA